MRAIYKLGGKRMVSTKRIPLMFFVIIFALSFNLIFAQADKRGATVKDDDKEEEVYKRRRLKMVEEIKRDTLNLIPFINIFSVLVSFSYE